ncbi:MAG TPA: EamA family transporter [Chitinophagaceae bacterium]|nr:EamA family transporter [Chitinophagaceae bacterium]
MKQNWKIIAAFSVIYFIWGTTYLAILFAIRDIPPLLMSAMRFLLAGIVLYIFCLVKNERHPDYTSFMKIMFRGILMLVGGTVSVAWAEQYLPSSTTAIIVTSVPFWFVLLDRKQWSYYFSNKILILGLVIGFVGVALLTNFNHTGSADVAHAASRTTAILVLIAGGIAWTGGSLISKYKPTSHSLLMTTSIQLIVSGFFCLFLGIFTGESDHFYFPQVRQSAWLGFLYLAVFGSIVTYLCYLWLLKVRPAAQVSSYVYVNPVVAILLGGLIGKESVTWLHILSLGVILFGVLLINLPKYKIAKPKKINLKYEEYCA